MRYPESAAQFKLDRPKWAQQMDILDRALTYVSKWGTAIDGGAYIGAWSERMLERFGKVIAFEPVPSNIECLTENVPGVTLMPLALSDSIGIETYRIKGAGFAEIGEGDKETPCTTIDAYEYEELGLIKLDVEGREAHALRGAKHTIAKHSPVLIVEMKLRYDLNTVRFILRQYGYRMAEQSDIDQVWIK